MTDRNDNADHAVEIALANSGIEEIIPALEPFTDAWARECETLGECVPDELRAAINAVAAGVREINEHFLSLEN